VEAVTPLPVIDRRSPRYLMRNEYVKHGFQSEVAKGGHPFGVAVRSPPDPTLPWRPVRDLRRRCIGSLFI